MMVQIHCEFVWGKKNMKQANKNSINKQTYSFWM